MWILGSHNSWSYLPVRKWWMKPLTFAAKCQDLNIKDQYNIYNVRCFDLRIRFDENDGLIVAHGIIEYDINVIELLKCLEIINSWGNCYIRVIHEVRTKKAHTQFSVDYFKEFCNSIESKFKNIKFWGGSNLYDYATEYIFRYNPLCEGFYSSVCPPKIIDDWWPRLYAKFHNKEILTKGTDSDILMIDFVNYGH